MRSDELLESGAQELLSPLANVLGFAHLLNRLATNRPSDWSPESRSSIGMLVGEAERLKTVAEAFIEQLRLQEGVFALHPDEVEVDGLVHEEVRAFGRRWPHSHLTEDFADSAADAGVGYGELLQRLLRLGLGYRAEWQLNES